MSTPTLKYLDLSSTTGMSEQTNAPAKENEDDADVLISKIKWGDVQRELKGRVSFQSPVVTHEVLLESLRATSVQLLHVTSEHNVTKRHVHALQQDNEILKEAVDTLNTQVNELHKQLTKTNLRMEKAESWMKKAGDPDVLGSLGGRMNEIEAHKEYIVQLEDLFSRFGNVETWKQNFVGEWAAHRAEFDATKEWQAVTEAWIEETKKAQEDAISAEELKEIIDNLHSKSEKVDESLKKTENRLLKHEEDLAQGVTLEEFNESKAMVEQHEKTFSQVTALAQGMTDKLEHASNEVERMADRVDKNAQRVDELYEGIEDGTIGGGITPEEVDEKIGEKYALIVDQLESAIRSATEDEDEFRRIANDLQDMVRKMQMGKADKREMAEVREKLMVDSRLREQVDTLRVLSDMKVSHEEAAQMLKSKASRKELKQSLNRLSSGVDAKVKHSLEVFEDAHAGAAFGTVESLRKSSSRGSYKLCLGCNRRMDSDDQLIKSNVAAHPHDSSRRFTSPGASTDAQVVAGLSISPTGRNAPNVTHMGPGGAALGGGFQVRSGYGKNDSRQQNQYHAHQTSQGQHRHSNQYEQNQHQQGQRSRQSNQHSHSAVQLSIGNSAPGSNNAANRKQQFHSLPPEYSLPQIDPRLKKPATFVMGTDGRVYPGQRKQQLHTFNLGRSSSVTDVSSPGSRSTQKTPSRVNIGRVSTGPETNGSNSPFMTQVSREIL